MIRLFRHAALAAFAAALTACNVGGSQSLPAGGSPAPASESTVQVVHRTSSTPIKHVVFILQENRSFNNLFMGYPGATTQNYGYDNDGTKIVLHKQGLSTDWDIDHSSRAFFLACDGQGSLPGTDCKMDGWNQETAGPGQPPNFAYAYVPQRETAPYWDIAKQYVLADQMFASNLDGSFVAHQYAVAAYASRSVNSPGGDWGCEGGSGNFVQTLTAQRAFGPYVLACFSNPTIGIDADKAGLSWRFYAGSLDGSGSGGLWSSYQADEAVYYGPDWSTDVINPPAQFLVDVAAGKLADITWITPTLVTSDHAGLDANKGPSWVASLVDTIGKSPFWKSTAIFIMWDDWGGWFDPVQPVYEDYDGLGFRVPLLMVSPYAKQNYVTHVQYETASVLRFIEDNFGLPHLAASDKRANDPATDAFDYSQQPRKFEKIPGGRSASYWMRLEGSSSQRRKPGNIIGDD
ncbi:MAG TPA: alkaline phosphatase family protein [Candidatus Babeliales bacterium]|nr:alkaline phosphatase family protein [Candidatus Babeliales bacterium]